MKANELRIGNWIELESGKQTIIRGGGISAIEIGLLKVKPIPLTEEWLLKFGFERFRGMYKPFELHGSYHPSYQIKDEKTDGNETVYLCDCDDGIIGKPIKYVHELQNSYFALTGEELEIKQ
jgi:hypothetical protein